MRQVTQSFTPYALTVLGIDTARISGCAVRVSGRLHASLEANASDPFELAEVVRYAQRTASAGAPLVVIFERSYGGYRSAMIGLGVARGAWNAALTRAGHPKRRIVSVLPTVWRVAVLGRESIGARRAALRAMELRTACAEAGRSDLGPDEAAAICLSAWAAHSPLVATAGGVGPGAPGRTWR
jgi:hypothetical protein